jgi:hypothetical protein
MIMDGPSVRRKAVLDILNQLGLQKNDPYYVIHTPNVNGTIGELIKLLSEHFKQAPRYSREKRPSYVVSKSTYHGSVGVTFAMGYDNHVFPRLLEAGGTLGFDAFTGHGVAMEGRSVEEVESLVKKFASEVGDECIMRVATLTWVM